MSSREAGPEGAAASPGVRREHVVETLGLTMQFRGGAGVRDLGLRVRPGRVYGLLGPNGAGKSTTLKLLLGLLQADSGEVRVFGQPWRREVLARVGASIDGPALYPHLSGVRNLEVHARLLGLAPERVAAVLEQVGLGRTGRQKVRTYSTGMRGRLALAVALVGDPELLVLDEPQNGLDPEGMVALRHLIRAFAEEGRTVVVSSHQLHEVTQLVDDVGVLVAGRLRFQGELNRLAPDGDLERAYFTLTSTAPAGRAA